MTNESSYEHPKRIFLFSGKRKSGKDYVTERLLAALEDAAKLSGHSAVVLRLSGPLKHCYATEHDLDFDRLMSADSYKEQHRKEMIRWSEEIRNKDPGYFCRAAIEMYEAKKHSIWIVSDCRRKSDVAFFKSNFPPSVCKHVRVETPDPVRVERGFIFTAGIDDAETECGFDDVDADYFDFKVMNDGGKNDEELIRELLLDVQRCL